jgi:hypothetical protein
VVEAAVPNFAVLDLAPSGFHVPFEATWIRRGAGVGSATTLNWHDVQTPAELEHWSEGHGPEVQQSSTGRRQVQSFALSRSE